MKFFKKTAVKNNEINETGPVISISRDIKENITRLENDFGHDSDLVVHYFKFDDNNRCLICANIYIKSLVDRSTINSLSIELGKLKSECRIGKPGINIDALMSYFSGLRDAKEGFDYEALYTDLLSGNIVFLINGCKKYLAVAANSDEGRSIEESSSQTVVKGPKDSFTEKINTNILLIRKRIKSKDLKVEFLSAGSITI